MSRNAYKTADLCENVEKFDCKDIISQVFSALLGSNFQHLSTQSMRPKQAESIDLVSPRKGCFSARAYLYKTRFPYK